MGALRTKVPFLEGTTADRLIRIGANTLGIEETVEEHLAFLGIKTVATSGAYSDLSGTPTSVAASGILDAVPYTGATAALDLGLWSLSSAQVNTPVLQNSSAAVVIGSAAHGATFPGPVSVPAPTADAHATTKQYVDDSVAAVDLSGYVPYTGASSNVDLGANELTANKTNTGSLQATGTTFFYYDNIGSPIMAMSSAVLAVLPPAQFSNAVTIAVEPTIASHAATKNYVDNSIATVDLSDYVPYTGAGSSVDLGSNALTTTDTITAGTFTNNGGQTNAEVFGLGASVSEIGGTVFGRSASATDDYGVAIGYQATAARYGIAAGYQADAGNFGVAMGYLTDAGVNGFAMGRQANNPDGYGVALGYLASAGTNSVAMLQSASAGAQFCIAIGNSAAANTQHGIALGASASAAGRGVAISELSSAGTNAISIGRSSAADMNSIAIGAYAATTASNQLAIGSATVPINEVVFPGSTTTIKLAAIENPSAALVLGDATNGVTFGGDVQGDSVINGDLKLDKVSANLDIGTSGSGSPSISMRGTQIIGYYSGRSHFTSGVLYGATPNIHNGEAAMNTNLGVTQDGFAARAATAATGSPKFLDLGYGATEYFNVNGYTGAIYTKDNITADGDLTARSTAMRSGISDPDSLDIPDGFGVRWKNTTTGDIRDFVNDGGTIYKSAAYTT